MTAVRPATFCPNCGTRFAQETYAGELRPVCPACRYVMFFDPKVAVATVVTDAARLLLIQRRFNPGAGRWALPAGFVSPGEHPADAAAREVLEETGLRVSDLRLLAVFGPAPDGGAADIVIGYRADGWHGTLAAGDDAADARWFTADALPDLVFQSTLDLVKRWREDAV